MRRGRGQVLFKFMPEQIVDYADNHAIGKVARIRGKEIQNVDMIRLLDTIRRYASRFQDRIQGFPRNWMPEDFILIEPTCIELDLFPLTFFCKSCHRASRFGSVQDFEKATSRYGYRCPKCKKGELQQFDIVHFHTCGRIETLVVPKCDDHGTESVILEKFGSSSIKRWIWQCNHPEHGATPRNLSRVGAHCYSHPKPEFMSHGPFSSSYVYYPESLVLVNVPPLSKKNAITDDVWKLVLAEYLGLVPIGTAKELGSGKFELRNTSSIEEMRNSLIEEGIPSDHVDKIIARIRMPAGLGEIKGQIDSVNKLIDLNGDNLAKVASQIFNYTQIISMEGTESISKAISRAEGLNAERIRQAPRRLSELGFANAFITTDFPLVRATFGYSRGDPERNVSTLRAFPHNQDFEKFTPIYGAQTQTEAIVLRIDQIRVLKWMHSNGWISHLPSGDASALNAWFLQNVKPNAIPTYQEVPNEEVVTKWVYRLTHSLSHLLLRHISAIAGIDRDSLGEFLFPNIPAFAIYANNSQEFQLGGLYTLFENSIAPWLEVAFEEVRHCLNDPICIESETSCHACLLLSEISCEHFNRELGRDVIIGSRRSQPKIGFWSEINEL